MIELELKWLEYLVGAVVKWARQMGWNIWMEHGAGVKWAEQMSWNIWIDLDFWLELMSNGLEYLAGDGVKWAGIF